jgi:Tol biopolymer transport system component
LRLKTTAFSVRVVCFCTVLAAVAACSNNKSSDTTVAPTPTPLHVQEIIVEPKAASPGDTVRLTADIRSSSQNVGDIPTTQWSATGGTFIENNEQTVRWVAPANGGTYAITVKATNHAGSTSQKTDLFVGETLVVVPAEAGELHLMPNGMDFYYRRAPTATAVAASGVEAYSYIGGSIADAVIGAVGNDFSVGPQLVFSPTLTYEVHSHLVTASDSTTAVSTLKPIELYIGDLGSHTMQRITQDKADPTSPRRHQFLNPSISPDGDLIAYQGLVTNSGAASSDSMDIFVYRRTGPTRVRATFLHANHRNYFPTFSTDQAWITFLSDRVGSNEWELFAMPVNSGVVDTNPADVQRLTSTGGTMASGSNPARPLMEWNPVSPVLAVRSVDGVLYLITMNGGGGTTQEVAGLPNAISELRWSPDGSRLAVVATGKNTANKPAQQIYVVTGGSATLRLTADAGDVLRDMVWSPDDAWIVFRQTRDPSSWFELLDVDAGRYPEPIAITAAAPTSNLLGYRDAMSMSAAWGASNVIYLLRFSSTDAAATPAVLSLDVNGAIQ